MHSGMHQPAAADADEEVDADSRTAEGKVDKETGKKGDNTEIKHGQGRSGTTETINKEDKCVKCDTGEKELIQCERCDEWSCFKCQNIPAAMGKAINKFASLHWYCLSCEPAAVQAARLATKELFSQLSIDKTAEAISKIVSQK